VGLPAIVQFFSVGFIAGGLELHVPLRLFQDYVPMFLAAGRCMCATALVAPEALLYCRRVSLVVVGVVSVRVCVTAG